MLNGSRARTKMDDILMNNESIACIIFTSDNSESRVVSNRCGGLSLLTLVKVKIWCRSVMCINLEVTDAISEKDHVDSPFH
ncbi:hypothetical protein T12_7953 [Trichinella patagoniensis]|uniref:Uncharacterized protein n=1 Tax=Trichinella patagoniensis TaxID=990121 RepID=A0A0V0ZGQ9_9BILA|nr:hypothetical protein T12_7953 [Trichinella patagoniensis]